MFQKLLPPIYQYTGLKQLAKLSETSWYTITPSTQFQIRKSYSAPQSIPVPKPTGYTQRWVTQNPSLHILHYCAKMFPKAETLIPLSNKPPSKTEQLHGKMFYFLSLGTISQISMISGIRVIFG